MKRPEQYQIPEFDSFESFLRDWLSVRDVDTLVFVVDQTNGVSYGVQFSIRKSCA